MVTETDIVRQVAGMKCPSLFHDEDSDIPSFPELCPECQGTGLRYPLLSRECERQHPPNIGTYPCSDSSCSGRIPDVTLEKICELVDTIKLDKYCDGWQCWITIEDNDAVYEGYGICEFGDDKNMPLSAACAALLAT